MHALTNKFSITSTYIKTKKAYFQNLYQLKKKISTIFNVRNKKKLLYRPCSKFPYVDQNDLFKIHLQRDLPYLLSQSLLIIEIYPRDVRSNYI